MAKIFTFTTDAVGNPEAITVSTPCREVTIYEQDFGATAGFSVNCPSATDTAVDYPAGTILTFKGLNVSGRFYPGEVVGYIAAASGTLDMVQKED